MVFLTFSLAVSKVEGSIPGKSLRATGSRNSMKGTIMNTENGNRRKRSLVVLTNCGTNNYIYYTQRKIYHNKVHRKKIIKSFHLWIKSDNALMVAHQWSGWKHNASIFPAGRKGVQKSHTHT